MCGVTRKDRIISPYQRKSESYRNIEDGIRSKSKMVWTYDGGIGVEKVLRMNYKVVGREGDWGRGGGWIVERKTWNKYR